MVYCCCVIGCHNRRAREKGVSFHRIPAVIHNQGEKWKKLSSRRRSRWITAIKREHWTPNELTRLCSEHFASGKPADLSDTANPDWMPHLNMGYEATRPPNQARRHRLEDRNQRKAAAEVLMELSNSYQPETSGTEVSESGVACQTESVIVSTVSCEAGVAMIDASCQTDFKMMKDECCQTDQLTDTSESRTSMCKSLEKDAEKLKFYTGIPEWCVFIALFNLISSEIHGSSKLSKFEMFVMFFMKIRLNLFEEDLGYRFDVHRTTVSRVFRRILYLLAVKTKDLILWPDRDTLRLTMPTAFRKFFRQCCVIIDCTEVFIERPSNLLARAQVWSNYKHHSTIKFLIGITPQGTISYVSQCVGGRMSDKQIVESSNLINYLIPGDLILADRGFTCDEYARLTLSEVKTPPFAKGKKQLEKLDVDWSRELSVVRIHVERVIGVLKQKFTILQGILPISLIMDDNDTQAAVDKLVRVCCVLVNLCPSVVPQD